MPEYKLLALFAADFFDSDSGYGIKGKGKNGNVCQKVSIPLFLVLKFCLDSYHRSNLCIYNNIMQVFLPHQLSVYDL